MKQGTKVIIAMGTNCHKQRHTTLALQQLRQLIDSRLQATKPLETEAIGMDSDRFLNTLVALHTTLTLQQLTQLTKDIERMCGDTKEARNHNIVNIDIDILQYGDTRLHVDDWNRPYIATLLKQLNP